MRKALVPAVLAALFVHPAMALAQDAATNAPVDATTPAPPQSASSEDNSGGGTIFRGIRLEGDVGWDRFEAEGQKPSKLGYGGTIGIDGQYKRFVLGAEGSYWTPSGHNGDGFCVTISNTDLNCRHLYHEWGADLRAGYLVTPQLLVFGKGGWAQAHEDVYIGKTDGRSSLAELTLDGYQYGGGVEYSLPMRGLPVYITAQYVRSQYDHHNTSQRVFGGVGIRFR